MRSDRRNAIKKLAGLTASAIAAGGTGVWLYGKPRRARGSSGELESFAIERSNVHPEMAVARGGDAIANTRAAISALGGMDTFITSGDRVMIKPNVAWKRIPEQAATTNPQVIAELVRLCHDAGAKEVVVFDSPCDPGAATFRASGILEAGESVGARVVYPAKTDYIKVAFGGKLINRWMVWKELPTFDKVINAAIVKHHCQSRLTAGMKNWYGILGGDRGLLHQDIHGSIVDLADAVRPTLTVLDAQRVLMRNGPTGGSMGDVKLAKAVAAGTDPVALDAWACLEVEQSMDQIPFIRMAEERGIGSVDWRNLRLKEVQAG